MAAQRLDWEGFFLTRTGSNHDAKNLVNQDYCLCEGSGNDSPAYAVVSDGHSSAPRGDVGSQMACRLAADLFKTLHGRPGPIDPEGLRRQLIEGWRAEVEKHCEAHPLGEPERALAERYLKSGQTRQNVIWRLYGATLLAALLTEQEAVYIQLGDGDIFCASTLESIGKPIPDDARQFANETFSLCSLNAHQEDICRIKVIPLKEEKPVFIWISTDGVGNSYPDNRSFHKLVSDSLQVLEEIGLEQFRPKLERHFDALYKEGCGDDFSVALLYDPNAKEIKPELPSQTPVISADLPNKETEVAVDAHVFEQPKKYKVLLLVLLLLLLMLAVVFWALWLSKMNLAELQQTERQRKVFEARARELAEANGLLEKKQKSAETEKRDLENRIQGLSSELEQEKNRTNARVVQPTPSQEELELRRIVEETGKHLAWIVKGEKRELIEDSIQKKFKSITGDQAEVTRLQASLADIVTKFLPEYQRLEMQSDDFKKNGINEILSKKIDFAGKAFRAVPTAELSVYVPDDSKFSTNLQTSLKKKLKNLVSLPVEVYSPKSAGEKGDHVVAQLKESGEENPSTVILYFWDTRTTLGNQ